MHKRFLQFLSAFCLLSPFWSILRIEGITIFDLATPFFILFALPYRPRERGAPFSRFHLVTIGIILLAAGGIISLISSSNPAAHVLKVVALVVALSGMVGFAYILVNRKIFTSTQALSILCLSATISSFVCILQGQFGILTSLIPNTIDGVQQWTRMTGLAEHPIETGTVSAFGTVIALGLALHSRKWVIFSVMLLINLYAMKFSASLTAFFAVILASGFLCLYMRAYKIIIAGIVVGFLGASLLLAAGSDNPLTSRVLQLSQSQGNYSTLRDREMQWNKSLEMIGPATLFIGNGYALSDLPYGAEIHNGLIASVFHFGLLGLASQLFLIAFFCTRLNDAAPATLKGIMLGFLVVFLCGYMTGPPFSRRSLWVPLFVLGSYLNNPKQNKARAPLFAPPGGRHEA